MSSTAVCPMSDPKLRQPFQGAERVRGKTPERCIEESVAEANVISEILHQGGYEIDVLGALGCLLLFAARYKRVYPKLEFEALAELLAEYWIRAESQVVEEGEPLPSGLES